MKYIKEKRTNSLDTKSDYFVDCLVELIANGEINFLQGDKFMEFWKKILNFTLQNKDTLALILAVLSFLQNYFNKRDAELENKQDKYLKILIDYFNKKEHYSNTIDSIQYFKNLKNKETCIPPYIFYVVENKTKDELDKILTVDYWRETPNLNNNILRNMNKLSKFLYYLQFVFLTVVLIGTILSSIFILDNDMQIIINGKGNILIALLKFFISILFTCFLSWKILKWNKKNSLDLDMYTFKKDNIDFIINEKIKFYDKYKDDYYI